MDPNNKRNITILWLDDMRNPLEYFKPTPVRLKSNAYLRNKNFYDNNIFGNYNPNFVWVKNFDEFITYIQNNNMPDMVSFDHDLGKGLKKGLDCANWLIQYCEQNGMPMPKCFVHSANKNGQREIGAALNLQEHKIIKTTKTTLQRLVKESLIKHLFI